VTLAAFGCSAVVSLCLLLGFKISQGRPLFLKQSNYIKLVNKKFSRKFMVLLSDGLF